MGQYDPKKVNITVDGFVVTGYAEDTFISGERNTEKRSLTVGADGNPDVNKSADDTGTVSITLKANSPANAKLKELYKQDDPFNFLCIDQNMNGDVGISGSECVVENLPNFEKAAELGETEWSLLVFDYENAFDVNY